MNMKAHYPPFNPPSNFMSYTVGGPRIHYGYKSAANGARKISAYVNVQQNAHQTKIPQELVANIFDILRLCSDRATLKSCALSCKEWAPLAQAQLFYEVTVDTESQLHKLASLVKNKDSPLAQHIRTLRIKPYRQSTAMLGLQQMQDWIYEVPDNLAPSLYNLRTLHLVQVDFTLFRMTERSGPANELKWFPCIKQLKLTSCKFACAQDFQNLAVAYLQNELVSLFIDMVSWEPWRRDRLLLGNMPHSGQDLPVSNLKNLQIGRFCDFSAVCTWLIATRSFMNLTELELYEVGPGDLQSAGSLLFQLGPILQHLTLGCKFARKPQIQNSELLLVFLTAYPCLRHRAAGLGSYLRLSSNTKLQTLRIRMYELVDDLTAWIPWIFSDISDPGGPQLREITFDIWLYHSRQLRTANWNEIEHILNRDSFSTLELVTFIQRGHVEVEESIDYQHAKLALRRRFPSLHQRCILSVVDGKEHVGTHAQSDARDSKN
ncbi:hypothetical protein NM688_g7993 [Phlebia brevispora]|uniref:Uncharacterized protein n=1 Tax=Phlebia brevispora TaxID=194682 RepID=A0ACC1RYS7_9APHY|nr:hypothetical protein NM688_g7993 [Phlebia brevispora]